VGFVTVWDLPPEAWGSASDAAPSEAGDGGA
jgi:hypothetical protein